MAFALLELQLLSEECVLLLQNVFSYYRMCSLPIDGKAAVSLHLLSEECVLLLQNVLSSYRMCSLPIDGFRVARARSAVLLGETVCVCVCWGVGWGGYVCM